MTTPIKAPSPPVVAGLMDRRDDVMLATSRRWRCADSRFPPKATLSASREATQSHRRLICGPAITRPVDGSSVIRGASSSAIVPVHTISSPDA
jgi:hypothetical protein